MTTSERSTEPPQDSPEDLPLDGPILMVGERSYQIDDLPEGSRRLIQAIRDAEEQALQLKRQINYIEIARRALIQDLLTSLPSQN